MKRIISILFLGLMLSPALRAQQVAWSIRNGTSDPASCQPSVLNVFFNRTSGLLKFCSATNTWSAGIAINGSGGAPLNSPVFTGDPRGPTATFGDSDTSLATTAFVQAAIVGGTAGVASFNTRVGAVVSVSGDYAVAQVTGAAPLASPTFTGTPAAPNAAADTNTTQVATTAFVVGQAGAASPTMNGAATVGTSLKYSRQDHVHPSDTSKVGTHNLLSTGHPDTLAASVVLGDIIFGNSTPAWARLAGNTTTAKQYFSQTGNGSISAAPVWAAIAEADVTNLTTDLAAKVATTRTINTTAPITGGGDLSADRTIAISNFTGDSGSGGAKGAVPAPASGDAAAGKFLKADATWAVPAGGGTSTLTVASTDAGTSSGTSEETLWTYTLPAATLSSNSKGLHITVYWKFAANANVKTARVYFGSKKIASSDNLVGSPNNRKESLVVNVFRDGSSSEKIFGVWYDNGTPQLDILPTTATEDTTATIVIKMTGQDGSASANDVVFSAAVVEAF